MSSPTEPLDLLAAEAALERGDYGQCLELLAPMAESHPLPDAHGARVRLLMVTAWMGQGNDSEAIATCRLLTGRGDPELRQQAKQLLTILEAPALTRPDSWSMRLPQLEMSATGSGTTSTVRRRKRRPPAPAPPPTGPTQAPALGFAALVAAVLLGLTLLLSGCIRIEADLTIPGPDRVAMSWQLQSGNGRLMPWQRRFEEKLHHELPQLQVSHPRPGAQRIISAAQPSRIVSSELERMVQIAAESAGVELPSPNLTLRERNWIVGVQQTLDLDLDLSTLPEIPDLEILLNLDEGRTLHSFHGGERMKAERHHWSWSGLGLGSIAVALLLLLSLLLQGIRRNLGFGFPELPS